MARKTGHTRAGQRPRSRLSWAEINRLIDRAGLSGSPAMDLRPDEDRRAPDSTPGPSPALSVTVDLSPSPPPSPGPEAGPSVEPSARPVAVVEGSGANLSAETRSLLRTRLRAAGLILLVVFGLFLLRRMVGILVMHAPG